MYWSDLAYAFSFHYFIAGAELSSQGASLLPTNTIIIPNYKLFFMFYLAVAPTRRCSLKCHPKVTYIRTIRDACQSCRFLSPRLRPAVVGDLESVCLQALQVILVSALAYYLAHVRR